MLKRLLFFIIFISSLLVSKEGLGQCDVDCYVSGNPNDSCFIAGNDITFNYSSNVGWIITNNLGVEVFDDMIVQSQKSWLYSF